MIFTKKVKLELGGGENPQRKEQGFINVDKIKHKLVDVKCNFEKEKLPYKDRQVEAIFCKHCLEHIKNVKKFMNECWRVLQKNGRARFIVPYGLWDGSFKPVHHNQITPAWFDFFRKENVYKIYGYKKWKIEQLTEIRNDKYEIYELDVILIPEK